jgi:hypothetical protein
LPQRPELARRHAAHPRGGTWHTRRPRAPTRGLLRAQRTSTPLPSRRSRGLQGHMPKPQLRHAAAMVSLSYLILSISQAGNLIFHRGVNIPSWCTWPSPVREIRYSITVHEAAAVVESGGDAGDAVAIRRRLRGGEGPVGMLGGRWAGTSAGPSVVRLAPTPSTLPFGDSTDMGMDYSQPNATLDLYVNVLVRPTRISPRQSGAAGPCSTLRGCTARPGLSVTYCSPAAPTGPSP